jgi:soluble lytic murein transglycosylase
MSSRAAQPRAASRRRSSAAAAAAARRRAAKRRRRGFLFLGFLAAVAVAVVVFDAPFRSAVRDLSLPLAHEAEIRQQAREKQLDPALIAGVIYAESKFVDQTSSAGALGLMQLMPETATFIAQRSGGSAFTVEDLSTPEVNIAYGSWYLRYLLQHYGGDEVRALAAYNGGIGNVNRWIAEAEARGESFGEDDIPFAETREYVDRVREARRRYAETYAHELGIR